MWGSCHKTASSQSQKLTSGPPNQHVTKKGSLLQPRSHLLGVQPGRECSPGFPDSSTGNFRCGCHTLVAQGLKAGPQWGLGCFERLDTSSYHLCIRGATGGTVGLAQSLTPTGQTGSFQRLWHPPDQTIQPRPDHCHGSSPRWATH